MVHPEPLWTILKTTNIQRFHYLGGINIYGDSRCKCRIQECGRKIGDFGLYLNFAFIRSLSRS